MPNIVTYSSRRARGLCGCCGKVASKTARCPKCVENLRLRRNPDSSRSPFGGPPATLDQIAAVLGLTKERVRQLQERALGKMVKRMRAPREDVLRGLAILGCKAGEISAVEVH